MIWLTSTDKEIRPVDMENDWLTLAAGWIQTAAGTLLGKHKLLAGTDNQQNIENTAVYMYTYRLK